jgi:hypothetical protein
MPNDYMGYGYDEARARKTSLEADLADVKLQKEQGTLVLAEDVAKAWESVLGAVKAKLMSLPTKAAPIVASEEDAAVCLHLLESLVNEALEELSNYEPSIPESTARNTEVVPAKGDERVKATAKTDGERVGRPRKKVGRTK